MIKLPEVNRRNWKKTLRELDIAEFPSLPPALVVLRDKLKKKTPMGFAEESMGYARLYKYFEEFQKQINNIYIKTIDYSKFSARPPMPHQIPGVEFLLKNNRCILGDDMGLGKQLISNTLCLTSKRWVEIGKLKVGDQIYGSDGKLHNVKGVYPQGIKPIYDVEFSDGKVIKAGLEHLWNVRSINDKRRRGDDFWRTVSTEDLINNLQYKNRTYKWEIPRVKPIDYDYNHLVIPPYILGVLIADGSICNGKFNFCPGNLEVPELVSSFLTNNITIIKGSTIDYGTSNYYNFSGDAVVEYRTYIKSIGLDVIGDYKFIPEHYKVGSISQRKLLLQGLMDSDGTTCKGRTRYCSVSRKLAEDVVELVQSLGGLASIYVVAGGEKFRPDLNRMMQYQESYHVNIQIDFCPFLRPYNIARWKSSNKLVRNIVSIKYSQDADATCISVDSTDNLFVVDGHVLTHNTITTIYAALTMEDRHKILIVTLKTLKYNFAKEISYLDKRFVIVDKKWQEDKFTIIHYEALKKFKKEIYEAGFTILILDEAHKVRNPKAGRSVIVTEYIKCKTPLKIWLLTGTPIDNRPIDYFHLLKLIKHPLSKNWKNYVERYCDGRIDGWGRWQTDGHSNLEELHALTQDIFLRRLKTNAGIEMPQKMRRALFLELKNVDGYKQSIELGRQKRFEKLVDEVGFDGDVSDVNLEEMTMLMLHRQFCAIEKVNDGSLNEVIDSMLDENPDNKIIVFTNFRAVVDSVYDHIGADKCIFIDGRILDPQKRILLVDQFNENPDIKVLVCNLKVGGTGLNIQSANKVIVNDMDWVPSNMIQAEDRAYRIGQKRDVEVVYLVYDKTVEVALYNTIEEKMRVISTIIEGKEAEYFEGSVAAPDTSAEDKKAIIKAILAQMGM